MLQGVAPKTSVRISASGLRTFASSVRAWASTCSTGLSGGTSSASSVAAQSGKVCEAQAFNALASGA